MLSFFIIGISAVLNKHSLCEMNIGYEPGLDMCFSYNSYNNLKKKLLAPFYTIMRKQIQGVVVRD